MYIGEYLTKNDYDISPDDNLTFALDKMDELHCATLPVVSNGDLLGLLSEDLLLSMDNDALAIGDIARSLHFVYLYEYQHIYDALQYMDAQQLQLLPVLDKENHYLGVLTYRDLLSAINETMGNKGAGAIIVLELGVHDLSFSHIAHIFESENIRILHTAIREIPNTTKLELTIKVDKQHIASVVASLWRFDYVVKATFNDGSQDSDIKERYDILMNYLNL